MARVWQLRVLADGDTKAAQKEMRSLQRSVRGFSKNVRKVGRSLTKAVTLPIMALGALGVSELRETMEVTKKTDAVFESMGVSMKVTKGQLDKLVSSLESYSAIEGDIIQNAANVGLTFKALAGNPKLFEATTRAAVDMSAALGQDLQTTMTQLGKAMQEPAKGAAALGRNGTLAKADVAALQKMAKDGVPIWKQQAFILEAVNKQYEGQGKNVDPIKAIVIAVKNAAEALAVLLLPSITKVSEWLQKMATWVDGLSDRQRKWLGVLLLVAAAIGPLLVGIAGIASAVAVLIPIIAAITLPMILVAAAIVALIAAGVLLYKNWDTVKEKVTAAWEAIKSAASSTWTWIKNFISRHAVLIATAVTGPIGGLVMWMVRNWSSIRQGVVTAWELIRTTASNWADSVVGAIERKIDDVVGKVRTVWNSVRTGVADAWELIKKTASSWAENVVEAIEKAIGALPGKLKTLGAAAGTALATALKAAVNAVIGKWNGFSIPAVTVLGKQVTPRVDFPDLPLLARGGITRGPSIAGEAGPEAVVPLGTSSQAMRDRERVMREAGLMGSGMHVTINGAVDPEATARRVAFILGGTRLRMGGAV